MAKKNKIKLANKFNSLELRRILQKEKPMWPALKKIVKKKERSLKK